MKKLFYDIIGSAMEVHRVLGWGLLESVYQEALSVELQQNKIKHEVEVKLPIFYKAIKLEKSYRMDLVVDNQIIVELKAVTDILPEHRVQVFNYMRLTQKQYAILINFGEQSLHCERYYYEKTTNECYLIDKHLNRVF